MLVTKYSVYGILVMQELRRNQEPVKLSRLSEILTEADGDLVSPGYAQQFMVHLIAAGLVESVRGCSGGYKPLNRRKRLSAFEIVQAMSRSRKNLPSQLKPGRMKKVAEKLEGRLERSLRRVNVDSL
jgi:DNA-binding IscR family transcriptional regulator